MTAKNLSRDDAIHDRHSAILRGRGGGTREETEARRRSATREERDRAMRIVMRTRVSTDHEYDVEWVLCIRSW